MSVEQASIKIEFPCSYQIKIIGTACDNFAELMIAVVQKHAPEVTGKNAQLRPSKKGNYLSLSVDIVATGKEQLQAIFTDLKATGKVKMVL